jgi:NADH-quinone oxidoreductase subunit G
MLAAPRRAYVLLGGIDPAADLAMGQEALRTADLVVAATTHLPAALGEVAHVVLPIAAFAESSGTYVNIEGRWQSWPGAAKPPGESRPGWKVLRVLANLLSIPGVDYNSSEEVRDALKAVLGAELTLPVAAGEGGAPAGAGSAGAGSAADGFADPALEGQPPEGRWVDIPPYQVDALVRGSEALAKTKDGHLSRNVI